MPSFEIPGMPGAQMGMINLGDMLGKALGGGRTKPRKMTVDGSLRVLVAEESDKLLDQETVVKEAICAVEQQRHRLPRRDRQDLRPLGERQSGGDVSREGVQRDLLPLIEGTTVNTKYGPVKTDHVLFIASGAFHLAKPSDLLPELQGRLPIRVELKALTRDDLRPHPDRAGSQPDQAVQGVAGDRGGDAGLHRRTPSTPSPIWPPRSTPRVENIGARRLHTVLERLLEEISFTATDSRPARTVAIDAALGAREGRRAGQECRSVEVHSVITGLFHHGDHGEVFMAIPLVPVTTE